jgi:hypothetical protein
MVVNDSVFINIILYGMVCLYLLSFLPPDNKVFPSYMYLFLERVPCITELIVMNDQ